MSGGGFDLSGYVDVAERIEKFYEKYPDGSLTSSWDTVTVEGDTFVVVEAYAYRTADDQRPACGLAWEPYPGTTPYTRGSELMVGQTSAWGRAIAALGFEVKRGIASKQEVQNRQGGGQSSNGGGEASPNQKRFLTTLLKQQGLSKEAQKAIVRWRCGQEKATKAGASALIDEIKEKGATGDSLILDLHAAAADGNEDAIAAAKLIPSGVPVDDEGLPPADVPVDTSDFEPDGKAAAAPQPGEPEAF